MYVPPNVKIHSSFSEAKEDYARYGALFFPEDKSRFTIGEIARGTRNLVVGEPGVGKTMLLGEIQKHLSGSGQVTKVINLGQVDALDQVENFLASPAASKKTLLLDGLDEVRASSFPAMIKKIEDVGATHPEIDLYVSCRWAFISRYAKSFSEYRLVTVYPFTRSQVNTYLLAEGFSEEDVEPLFRRVLNFGHEQLVVQVPRYLSFLVKYMKEKGVKNVAGISRNELFEYFIYSGLEIEDQRLSADRRTIIKRVLEKLALTMEIYQTNTISKDDLMTFFDELKSDLKLAALGQIDLQIFFDKALLKDFGDSVSFHNTEFQEYLAAKEVTRFADPRAALFDFAVDPEIRVIYPSWFNALSFLIDLRPDLLEPLIEFSGIRRKDKEYVADEGLITFMGRIDAKQVPIESRQRFFADLLEYHNIRLQWLPTPLGSALPNYFESSQESTLKAWVAEAEGRTGADRYVPLANIALVVGFLFERGVPIDRAFWRAKLIAYASDDGEYSVLREHALYALGRLRDPSVMDELPASLVDAEETTAKTFLSMCADAYPDHPKSIEHFIEAVKKDNFYGRYGFLEIKEKISFQRLLESFNDDEVFRFEFLEDSSIFQDRDHVLIDHLSTVMDDSIAVLARRAIVLSLQSRIAHRAEKLVFITGLWRLLKSRDPGFLSSIVDTIVADNGADGLYYATPFLAEVITKEDVSGFIEMMIAKDEKQAAFQVMTRIKFSGRDLREEVFEAGRAYLPDEYAAWEARMAAPADPAARQRDEETLKEFRFLLEPAPGEFSDSVFEFYNQNEERLKPLLSDDDKERLAKLITGTVLKLWDPIKHELKYTEESENRSSYTTNKSVHVFEDALVTASRLGIDVEPYRQQIINFIPFAYDQDLEIIFGLIKGIRAEEITPVIKIYEERRSDHLWRHRPISFVDAVEKYHIVEAAPVLKKFVTESAYDGHCREQALLVSDSLAPDSSFLREVFDKYKDSNVTDEQRIAQAANELLIRTHADSEAVRWRIARVMAAATPFTQPEGAHSMSSLEDELSFRKPLAKPLMDFGHAGFEDDYLQMLDSAMDLWAKGEEYHAYATYLWEIVRAYFDNLKGRGSYEPLKRLEDRIAKLKDKEGSNWFARIVATLRRSYLSYFGKPQNISEAIRKHNKARERDNKKILNTDDLFMVLQECLDTDLKNWIENEGAYELILGKKVFDAAKQPYEKLIQRTLKTQLENAFLKRGIEADIVREPQLIDETRIDFLIRYGFIGPIPLEVKLSSNKDINGSNIEKSDSFESMSRYMRGYGASRGVFLVIDNTGAKNSAEVKAIFEKIPGVTVKSIKVLQMAPKKWFK